MKNLKNRFWSKVIKTSNCWEWDDYTGGKGYGRFYVNGRKYLAHRFAFELEYGKIPEGLCVLHHCDNPSCVRLDHLFLGTIADNNRDSAMKGRNFLAIGESNGNSKLTNKDILQIKRLHNQNGMIYKQLAKRFNVHHHTIGNIISGRNWKHL